MGITFAVCILSPGLDISAAVQPIVVKFCMLVDVSDVYNSPFRSDIYEGPLNLESRNALEWTIFGLSYTDFSNLTANIPKTSSHSVTCQIELNMSSTADLPKKK